ncbi:NAD-dependent malic enzyme [bacterium]|nr:NAD-dependent malic enzyme [bacterium]
MTTPLRGLDLLREPLFNKGTAFTLEEREALGLQGLLPPCVHTLEQQVAQVIADFRQKSSDIERYLYLSGLEDRNETLFYRALSQHLEEMMPIVYTPTVGDACLSWSDVFRRPRGLYISLQDRGSIAALLRNWPHPVRVIVVTDGERILGLGDLGVGGMGISIGKLALYAACAGIHPRLCLPVMLDVGTQNQHHLQDPLYLGLRRPRLRGDEYDEFVAEFVSAVQEVMPKTLIQFEDFGNLNAFRLLDHWRQRVCTFNDDIQGTAAVTLAGLLSALRITNQTLAQQRILFLGAGEAGVGIGDLMVSAIADQGLPLEEARRHCWFVDTQGLIVQSRSGLADHKLRYAHDHPPCTTFLEAIERLKPTTLIGVSTMPGSFNQAVVERMSQLNERPILFALSNPTSKAECTAQDAYRWSRGKAIYSSGSPFPPCQFEGKKLVPGQGNNAYIFPGVGLGVTACEARHVSDKMFSEAARVLASCVTQDDLEVSRVYPALSQIRPVSELIAVAVARVAFEEGLAGIPQPSSLEDLVKSTIWKPEYS